MDVSPLNLGMIAAYYNISCKLPYFHLLFFVTDSITILRCHR